MELCHVCSLDIIFPPPKEPGNHRYGKMISTNPFESLILFLSLRLFNWSSNICKRECSEANVVSEYFSLKQLYIMKMEAEGAKLSDAAFKWGKTCLEM